MPFQGDLILVFSLLFALLLGFLIFFSGQNLSQQKAKPERKKSRIWVAITVSLIAFFLCSFVGIMYAYQGPPTPVKKPLPQDLVGTWTLTEASKEELLKLGKLATTNQIIFSDNGSCNLVEVPKLIVSSSGYDVQFLSGKGTWTIEKDSNNDWVVRLSVLLKDSPDQQRFTINISGKQPPFTLYQRRYNELSAWSYSKENGFLH